MPPAAPTIYRWHPLGGVHAHAPCTPTIRLGDSIRNITPHPLDSCYCRAILLARLDSNGQIIVGVAPRNSSDGAGRIRWAVLDEAEKGLGRSVIGPPLYHEEVEYLILYQQGGWRVALPHLPVDRPYRTPRLYRLPSCFNKHPSNLTTPPLRE